MSSFCHKYNNGIFSSFCQLLLAINQHQQITYQASPSKGDKILCRDDEMTKILDNMEIKQQTPFKYDSGDEGKELDCHQAFKNAKVAKNNQALQNATENTLSKMVMQCCFKNSKWMTASKQP